jgi:YidC/Oxa1 family membrane protein insertase
MTTLANIVQPFEDLAESIITFFQDQAGLSWGLAIVALTFTVRLAVLPLSLTGIRSMRRMQLIAPQLKELQEKYKDDRERQQREMLSLYRENGVNPLASCFPFLLQIPFFIAIYQLLRSTTFKDDVIESGASQSFLFIDSIIEKPQGAETVILIALFIATTALTFVYTMAQTQTSGAQRYIFMALPIAFAPLIVSQPAGLGLYWIATNIWSLGQQVVVQRIMPAPKPPTEEEKAEAVKARATPPPPPPRKRKRRR